MRRRAFYEADTAEQQQQQQQQWRHNSGRGWSVCGGSAETTKWHGTHLPGAIINLVSAHTLPETFQFRPRTASDIGRCSYDRKSDDSCDHYSCIRSTTANNWIT